MHGYGKGSVINMFQYKTQTRQLYLYSIYVYKQIINSNSECLSAQALNKLVFGYIITI